MNTYDQGVYVRELKEQVTELMGGPGEDDNIYETLTNLESRGGVTVYWSIVQQNILPGARWSDFERS